MLYLKLLVQSVLHWGMEQNCVWWTSMSPRDAPVPGNNSKWNPYCRTSPMEGDAQRCVSWLPDPQQPDLSCIPWAIHQRLYGMASGPVLCSWLCTLGLSAAFSSMGRSLCLATEIKLGSFQVSDLKPSSQVVAVSYMMPRFYVMDTARLCHTAWSWGESSLALFCWSVVCNLFTFNSSNEEDLMQ